MLAYGMKKLLGSAAILFACASKVSTTDTASIALDSAIAVDVAALDAPIPIDAGWTIAGSCTDTIGGTVSACYEYDASDLSAARNGCTALGNVQGHATVWSETQPCRTTNAFGFCQRMSLGLRQRWYSYTEGSAEAADMSCVAANGVWTRR